MKQYIFAHRGASARAPENTLEAFGMAADMGAHGVELDVQICRGGEVVVAHDETVDRVSDGSGWIKDMTLPELKALRFSRTHPQFTDARIPTLREVFQLLEPTGVRINIELKNSRIEYAGLEEKVIDLAAREGMLERVIFSSFNHSSMLCVKEIDKSLPCGLLYDASMVKPWAYAVALGVDAIHPHFHGVLVPGGTCVQAHRAGIQVNTWTVDAEEDIRAVLREGADTVITNRPDVGLRCLEEMGKGTEV